MANPEFGLSHPSKSTLEKEKETKSQDEPAGDLGGRDF
jgi:hypothetical protein